MMSHKAKPSKAMRSDLLRIGHHPDCDGNGDCESCAVCDLFEDSAACLKIYQEMLTSQCGYAKATADEVNR